MLFRNKWEEQRAMQNTILTRYGIDHVAIEAQADYVKALIGFFKSRK